MRSSLILPALVVLLAAGPVLASHYPLEETPFITPEEAALLKVRAIEGTDQLLEATDTEEERAGLALATGIDRKRLREIEELCDLLQVRGIGPKMAMLMRLAGVYDTRALAAQKAEPLAAAMKKANDVHQASEILPEPEVIQGWIEQAASLRR
jgi:predicted flap endonuclease-1-like 5' DNA nuclease